MRTATQDNLQFCFFGVREEKKITLFSTFTMSKVQGQYKLVQEARDLKTTESAKDHL